MTPGTGGTPVALTIAGSDPSGGAGVQADLKTFSALGVYGAAVLTALTAQNTHGVTGVHAVPAGFVAQQLETLLDDVRVDAIKIGMLASADTVDAVGATLAAHPHEIVVLDPVMVATSGDRLLDDDALDAMRRLLPLASLVTPNLDEAAVLLDATPAASLAAMRDQAVRLLDLGAERVLVKGGHLHDHATSVDVFAGPEGVHELSAPWIDTRNTHGTGCTLSSAIAALRIGDERWVDASLAAKVWLSDALRAADELGVGTGRGPLHHFHTAWSSTQARGRGSLHRSTEASASGRDG